MNKLFNLLAGLIIVVWFTVTKPFVWGVELLLALHKHPLETLTIRHQHA